MDPNSATKMSDKGYCIDQHSDNPNPLYATMGDLVPNSNITELANYTTNTDFGQHAIKNGSIWSEAKLNDDPTTNIGIPDAEKVFETTALALDGPEKGKYYGSITWGCNTYDRGEQVYKHDIELKSMGDPSEDFFDAAKKMERW